MVMGCYGNRHQPHAPGGNRAVPHDLDGILWPWAIAPYQVLVCLLDPDNAEAAQLAKRIGEAAEKAGADVLIDDRAERPGFKFKDADLIGIPLRITIGAKGLKEGIVEFKWRSSKEVSKLPIAEVEARITAAILEKNGATA